MSGAGEAQVPAVPTPAGNPELLGHERAEAAILDAWTAGRMPHAWLIHGPAGIGKATLAYRVARFVLSERGGDEGPALFAAAEVRPTSLAVDPESPVSRLVASEGHPDLRVLRRGLTEKGDRLSNVISVKQVRAFEAKLHLKSKEGGWRVAIIDEAERLNESAENALLKILEEPPPKTLILIVSNSLSGLLQTTRSRCRRLALSPLADAVVERLLRDAAPDAKAADSSLVVRIAEGSIGRALALQAAGGAGLYRKVAEVLASLPAVDGERIHALADDWARRQKEGETDRFATAMGLVGLWIDRAIRAANGAAGLSDFVSGDLEAGARYVRSIGTEAAFRRREEVARLVRLEAVLNLDRRQVAMDALHVLAYGDGLERRPLAE